MERLVLNKHQFFMLQNKGLLLIPHIKNHSPEQVDDILEEKLEIEKNDLIEYLIERKQKSYLSS